VRGGSSLREVPDEQTLNFFLAAGIGLP